MTEKITAADAIRLLDTGKAVAVDVREPDEYAVGHIPGQSCCRWGRSSTAPPRCCRTKTPCGWCTAAPDAAAPTLCRSWKPLATPTCGTLAAF